jgi:hypothetical protein
LKIKYYNIHNIITFKIINNTNFIHKKFSNLEIQYQNFECKKKIEKTDFTVIIGEFKTDTNNCIILDDNFYVKENYIYCKQDSYKIAKWRFEITGFEKKETIIKISCNTIGEIFIGAYLIDFIIQFKLAEKGYLIIHASCVNKNNKGYIFSGRGGGGKTTIALKMIEQGFNFLGDNFIIIHDGIAFSFLSQLNIFTYNLTRNMKKRLNFKEKTKLKLKNIIYKFTLGYAKIFSQFNPKSIFTNSIIDQSKIDKIFLLLPKKLINIKSIKKEELIQHIIFNQKLDFLFFDKYITEYSNVFPNSNFSLYWKIYKDELEKQITNDIIIYKMEIPKKIDEKIINYINEVISSDKNN